MPESQAALLRETLAEAHTALAAGTKLRVLFSAHGLPEKIVRAGDPYQEQVETSVRAILAAQHEPRQIVLFRRRIAQTCLRRRDARGARGHVTGGDPVVIFQLEHIERRRRFAEGLPRFVSHEDAAVDL